MPEYKTNNKYSYDIDSENDETTSISSTSTSHEKIMKQFNVDSLREQSQNKYTENDDSESLHSFQSFYSAQSMQSSKSTHSESKLILNDLKTKLNQQKSVWNDIRSKTNKYIELYLLNSSYSSDKDNKINDIQNGSIRNIEETQSMHGGDNEMDEKQKKLYIRLQNNLIADLMKEKNKLNDKYIKSQQDINGFIKDNKSLKQEINDKNKLINDYKKLLSNTVHDMNKQNKLQNEINDLVQKVSFKDIQINKSTKAIVTISNRLSDYINYMEHTTNLINFKINKLNQNINKVSRKHQLLLLKTNKNINKSSIITFNKQLKEKDDIIQQLIEQKIKLIQETSKQMNVQRDVISKYQKERIRFNFNFLTRKRR